MRSHHHFLPFALCMLGIVCSFLFFRSTAPILSNIQYRVGDGDWKSVTLPFTADAPVGAPFTVTFDLTIPRIYPSLYKVAPDDCLESMVVNDMAVNAPVFCDFRHPRIVDLSPYLHLGLNTVQLNLRNQDWFIGLDFHRAHTDRTYGLLFFVITLLLLFSSQHCSRLWSRLTKSRRKQVNRFLWCAVVALLGCIALKAFYDLGMRLWYELQGPYTADTTIYWAVGRGILNGFRPYIDLYENKPPGIFFLNALSLALFDGPLLGHIVQALVIAGLPVLLAIYAFSITRKHPRTMILTVWWALIAGTLLALYMALRSGEMQAESFGAFLGALYAFTIIGDHEKFSWKRIAMATLFLCGAVGFKEPFVLSVFAIALLFAKHPVQLVRRFFIPLILAATLGILAMALLGYLQPYFSIYLDEMLGRHVDLDSSLWLRGFSVGRTWRDLLAFSPFFAWSILALFLVHLWDGIRSARSFLEFLWRTLASVLALYCSALAIGVGGAYWNHHYVFAVPLYVALCFSFIGFLARLRKDPRIWGVYGIFVLLFAETALIHETAAYKGILRDIRFQEEKVKQVAADIDRVLDVCGEERYLFLGGNGIQPYAFTKHSPLGPLFYQYGYLLGDDRQFFRDELRQALAEAPLVVVGSYDLNTMDGEVKKYLGENFTKDAWECGKNIANTASYQFFFRRR